MRAFRILLLLVVFLTSCVQMQENQGAETLVTVSFTLDETRSLYRSTESNVDDVCLWIFRDGALESYRYIERGTSAELSLRTGSRYSFYALANMYRDFEDLENDGDEGLHISSIDELKNLKLLMSDFLLDQTGCSLPMAGALEDVLVEDGTPVSIQLVRLFSKIVFRFDPDDGLVGENVVLTSVRLRNAASSVLPFNEGCWSEGVADGDRASVDDLIRMNAGGGAEFYCLENCCGVSSNANSRTKFPEGAPYGRPTYLEVCANVSGFNFSGSVTWRFCPGENNYNDYNLRRGYLYTVTLRSLYSTVEDGRDDWQVDTGDLTRDDGSVVISLYAGQFHKLKLNDWDEVLYYDRSSSRWNYFITYNDDDNQTVELPNGCRLMTRFSEENGSSCNPEFYVCSTGASLSDAEESVKVIHTDGTEDRYVLRPPLAPRAFDDISSIVVCEDGYDSDVYSIVLNGSLGQVEAMSFRIPENYLGEDWDYEDQWDLFRELYMPSLPAEIGCDLEMRNSRLCFNFYGKSVHSNSRLTLSNQLFSQLVDYTVTPAFPGAGYLGRFYNYELAPNSLQSSYCTHLPEGTTTHASWTTPSDCYLNVSGGGVVSFGFPLSGLAYRYPAFGEQEISGSVTNPHTGRVISGYYSFDVVLYLPLMASEAILSGSSNTTVIGATVAVGTTPSFYDNKDIWEYVFMQTLDFVELSLGGTSQLMIPSPDFEDAMFNLRIGSNASTYGVEFLARNAAVNLEGFEDPESGDIVSSLETDCALLVRFEDVNTTITPVCNVYNQGDRIYECLWGRRSD